MSPDCDHGPGALGLQISPSRGEYHFTLSGLSAKSLSRPTSKSATLRASQAADGSPPSAIHRSQAPNLRNGTKTERDPLPGLRTMKLSPWAHLSRCTVGGLDGIYSPKRVLELLGEHREVALTNRIRPRRVESLGTWLHGRLGKRCGLNQ